ncbi:hypothetical protein AgCh_008002 [Apium graveolens]
MMDYILGSDNGGVHFTFLEGSDNVGNQFSFLEDDDNVDAAITPSTSSKGWLSEGFNDHRKRMIKKGLRSIYKYTETQKVKVLMIIGRGNYYQEGNIVHTRHKVLDAYTRALGTWARWVDKNIDKEKTQAEKLRSVHREGGVGIAAVHIAKAADEAIFERISTAATSKEAWSTLNTTYKGEHKVKMIRLQALRGEFELLRMKETESVEDYFNRVVSISNQLMVNGEELKDQRIIEKILRSMSKKYEHIVVAIDESKNLSELPLESLLGSLQSHELRIKQFESSPSEQAFQMQEFHRVGFRGRGRGRNFRGKGRSQPDSYARGRSQARNY